MAAGGIEPGEGRALVWDWPLRLFHWLLVLSLGGSWLSAESGIEWIEWHFRLGYFAIGLIVFRLLWGFIGTRHSRFASFLRGPAKVSAYARNLFARDSATTAGHNPLGAWMVAAMILSIMVQVGTGLFATDDIFSAGPYNPAVSGDTASFLTSLHHWNFTVLQVLVGLHILAILYYRVWKRHRLTLAMVTGRKPAAQVGEGEDIASSRPLRALIAIALAATAVAALLWFAPEAVDDLY